MSIILIRHGETDLNTARVLQPPDTPLGNNGQAQAAAVAQRVATLAPVAPVVQLHDLLAAATLELDSAAPQRLAQARAGA